MRRGNLDQLPSPTDPRLVRDVLTDTSVPGADVHTFAEMAVWPGGEDDTLPPPSCSYDEDLHDEGADLYLRLPR